jgi:hypothetical protein
MRPIVLLLSLCLLLPIPAAAAVRASLIPEQPLIERARDGQRLNFDLLFANDGDQALELTTLEVTLFDRDGRFFSQRRLDRNGDSATMAILTIPNRTLPAQGRLVVFNPFARFPADAWLGELRYEASFRAGEDGPEQRVRIDVKPRPFQPKTSLSLPLRGEAFVHDGHDLTAHHRRLDTILWSRTGRAGCSAATVRVRRTGSATAHRCSPRAPASSSRQPTACATT